MKKILITGATGFVGGHLIDEALSRNYEVYAVVRKSSNTSKLDQKQVKIVELDFSNQESMVSKFMKLPDFHYIIHNAGVTKTRLSEDYYLNNSIYTQNFIRSFQRCNKLIQKFLYISSLAAIGPGDPSTLEPITNNDIPNPITNYGMSKLEAETFISNQLYLPYLIIRPTAIYGPGDKDIFQFIKLINKHIELYMGSAKQHLTFIYVKDLTRFVMDALESPYSFRNYFITDGNVYNTRVLGEIIRKELHKNTIRVAVPIVIVKHVASLLEKLSNYTGNYPALNVDKVAELTAINWKCDISSNLKDLNFLPLYTLEQGMAETIEWYKKEKWI